MKKIASILLILSALVFPAARAAHAQTADLKYAEILSGCVLYSDAELTMPITSLPETYFASVISEEGSVCQVTYRNIDGYAHSSFISAVDFTPKNKSAQSYLTLVNDGGTINVRAYPDHSSENVLARLTDGTKLYYYGFVEGSKQNALVGSRWYCVDLGENKLGYVYSMYVSVPPLPDNVIEPEPSPVENTVTKEATLTRYGEYFLVAALSLPVVLMMYLLFKPSSSGEKSPS